MRWEFTEFDWLRGRLGPEVRSLIGWWWRSCRVSIGPVKGEQYSAGTCNRMSQPFSSTPFLNLFRSFFQLFFSLFPPSHPLSSLCFSLLLPWLPLFVQTLSERVWESSDLVWTAFSHFLRRETSGVAWELDSADPTLDLLFTFHSKHLKKFGTWTNMGFQAFSAANALVTITCVYRVNLTKNVKKSKKKHWKKLHKTC